MRIVNVGKRLVVGALVTVSVLSSMGAAKQLVSADSRTGYVYSPEISKANGGYNWLENGQPFTGFRYYMGTYYWFVNGVRQNEGWREAWGYKYWTDATGRAVQGNVVIDGTAYNFGDNGTYYLRGKGSGYLYDGSAANGGYRWYENGTLYTGFRYYMGTYYWFVDGVRQNAGWRNEWGYTYFTDNNGRAVQYIQNIDGKNYYFGNNGTYYLRDYFTDKALTKQEAEQPEISQGADAIASLAKIVRMNSAEQ